VHAEPVYDTADDLRVDLVDALGGIGSFERDSNADSIGDGWIVSVGGAGDAGRVHTLSRIPTIGAIHGTRTQYVRIDSATNGNDSALITQAASRPTLVPGRQYTCGANIRSNSTLTHLLVRTYNASNVSQGDFSVTVTAAAATSMQRRSITYVAPPTAVKADIMIRGITAAGQYMEVDAVTQVPGAADVVPSSSSTPLMRGADYTAANGVVAYVVAPPVASAMFWSGTFYRRCRFLGESLDTEKFLHQLYRARRVEFISVKG
jgi:hypothetical protein